MSKSHHDHESFSSRLHHDFLKSLIGKEVQVYRKGPDSKIGKLFAAHSDYIALYVQKSKSMIYYTVHHIKSITENVKKNSCSYFEQEEDDIACVQANNFRGLLKQLINQNIYVNQGPDSRPGRLVAAIEDYIVLFTKDDGYVFFNIAHIKSITVDSDKETITEENMKLDYVRASSFHDIFRHMNHKWVYINGKGPEAVEGVLSVGTGGHYTLINNEEVLRIYPYHIKSISCGVKGSFKKEIENSGNNNRNEENKDDNMSETAQAETAQAETANQDSNSNSNSNSNKYSNKHRNHSNRYAREKVIASIDYHWKPKRRY